MELDAALAISAGLMGLAGMPHCALMCAAPCAAVIGHCGRGAPEAPWRAPLAFHGMRVLGYAAAGALAAASVGSVAAASRFLPWLSPLWSLLQAASIALGLWLLVTGKQPAFVNAVGKSLVAVPASAGTGEARPVHWGASRAGAAGMLWVTWPCGLLQSALVTSSLASSPVHGAGVMAGFAIASSAGLWAAPALWLKLVSPGRRTWIVRASGAILCATSGWALLHGLAGRIAAWCV